MRPHRIIVLAPLFDEYSGLFQRAENLRVEQLVSELAVKAFIVSILPWASRFGEEHLHADPLKPFAQGRRDKLWAILGSDVFRHAMLQHRISKGVQDVTGAQFTLHFDGQAFAGVLIDECQQAERGAIMRSILDEVISPDMVPMLWSQPHACPIIQP